MIRPLKIVVIIACILGVSLTFGLARNASGAAAAESKKVTICHVPPGNEDNPRTINISINAFDAHMAEHPNDYKGECKDPGTESARFCLDQFAVDFNVNTISGIYFDNRYAYMEGLDIFLDAAGGNFLRLANMVASFDDVLGEWNIATTSNVFPLGSGIANILVQADGDWILLDVNGQRLEVSPIDIGAVLTALGFEVMYKFDDNLNIIGIDYCATVKYAYTFEGERFANVVANVSQLLGLVPAMALDAAENNVFLREASKLEAAGGTIPSEPMEFKEIVGELYSKLFEMFFPTKCDPCPLEACRDAKTGECDMDCIDCILYRVGIWGGRIVKAAGAIVDPVGSCIKCVDQCVVDVALVYDGQEVHYDICWPDCFNCEVNMRWDWVPDNDMNGKCVEPLPTCPKQCMELDANGNLVCFLDPVALKACTLCIANGDNWEPVQDPTGRCVPALEQCKEVWGMCGTKPVDLLQAFTCSEPLCRTRGGEVPLGCDIPEYILQFPTCP